MLFPLVESSLSEEILRTWQRQDNIGTDARARLEALMKFLENEVQNEERISMARAGFELPEDSCTAVGKVGKRPKVNPTTTSVATAAGLLAAKEVRVNKCIFCEELHDNAYCEKAKQMPLQIRQNIAKEKNACFACLKVNHTYQRCRSKIKCSWCGRKHVLLMCKNISKNDTTGTNQVREPVQSAKNLTAFCNNIMRESEVHLQTLRVKLKGPYNEHIVRALIDTGSHKTYVLKSIADEMCLKVVGQQKMLHLLFGGEKTELRAHNEYQFNLKGLDAEYEYVINAYDEDLICRTLPSVSTGPWTAQLQSLGIALTDTGSSREPISLLIVADIAGKLYKGKVNQFDKGPTALHTKLGWTLMGRSHKVETQREDAALTVFSMFTREANILDLWEHDVLGIMDPAVTVSKEEHLATVKKQFRETINKDSEERYVVRLPWKDNHPPLSNNRPAAEKRLIGVTQKLYKENLYDAYEKVFDDWLQANIIEEARDVVDFKDGYFLPHRHVVKPGSTTPIRPVFDASASSNKGPSINQCLETGPNLIELIPNILLKFRENKIGVTADITKAFLQIGVAENDGNALKFLWWSKTDPQKNGYLSSPKSCFWSKQQPVSAWRYH